MQFLARDEARLLQKKLDRQIADKPRPELVLYYKSGKAQSLGRTVYGLHAPAAWRR